MKQLISYLTFLYVICLYLKTVALVQVPAVCILYVVIISRFQNISALKCLISSIFIHQSNNIIKHKLGTFNLTLLLPVSIENTRQQ